MWTIKLLQLDAIEHPKENNKSTVQLKTEWKGKGLVPINSQL